MGKLMMYGVLFYMGYKLGSMTPEQRKKLLAGVTSRFKNAEQVVEAELLEQQA